MGRAGGQGGWWCEVGVVVMVGDVMGGAAGVAGQRWSSSMPQMWMCIAAASVACLP